MTSILKLQHNLFLCVERPYRRWWCKGDGRNDQWGASRCSEVRCLL